MGILLFPLLFVFLRDDVSRQRVARRMIGRSFAAFIWLIRVLGVMSYEVVGRENMQSGRSHLIVANHPTLIDVVFLVSMFPDADCVIKDAVTRNPFMRSTVLAANYISNSACDDLLNSCVSRVNKGNSLLLFPEGTRTVPDQPIQFKPGAATVAVRTSASVLPIAIRCTPLFLTKDQPWYTVPEKRPHFVIRVMPPVVLGDLVSGQKDQRHARHAANDALRALITNGLRDFPERSAAARAGTLSQFS
jgi:1-acyl-sn-glycerol-3-phosphate acyltransferase